MIIKKEIRDKLIDELTERMANLKKKLNGKDLDPIEAYKLSYPEKYTSIDSIELSLAISDFKSILTEINKLKGIVIKNIT